MLKFFYRLEKCENSFPLLYDAYIESKTLAELKKPTWYMSVQNLISKIKSYQPSLKQGTKINNMILKQAFTQEWEKFLKNNSNGKLSSFVSFKSYFGFEKYLQIVISFEMRSLTRLRLSAHQLMIEKGRYSGIPRHNRVCPRCSSNEVEDEVHFLFNCTSLDNERSQIILKINAVCKNFTNLDSKNKLIWLMNNEDKDILVELCSYITRNEKYDNSATGASTL